MPEHRVIATWDGDEGAQHEPFLICEDCGEKLCSVEEGDDFAVLVMTVGEHSCSYRPDNLIGNVIGVISDRTGDSIGSIVRRIADTYGEGDFSAAEDALWDGTFGPMVDRVQDGANIK